MLEPSISLLLWFTKSKTRRPFLREIFRSIHSLNDVFEEQISLKNDINKLKESIKAKKLNKNEKSTDFWKHKETSWSKK